MRDTILGLLFVTVATIDASTPAVAEQFAGPHVEAIAGWTSGDRTATGHPDRHNDGLLYGGGAGYDFRFGNVVVGALGEISDATGSSCIQFANPGGPAGSGMPSGEGRSCGHESRTLFGGLRLGYVIGDRSLLYVSGGYVNARKATSFDGKIDNVALRTSGHEDLDGFRVGGGVERALASHAFVKAEYRYTAAGYHLREDQHQIVTGIGYRF